jgi:hypothetical protein
LSIGEIATHIPIPKTTISFWCRDIRLSTAHITKIEQRRTSKTTRILLTHAEKMRSERIQREANEHRKAAAYIGAITHRDIAMLGIGLYWGEGYKRSNGEFGFANSDPRMITFYLHFLYTCCAVTKQDIVARVSINATHAHRIHEVHAFWKHITRLPARAFTKPSLIQTKAQKIFPNASEHYGVLRLKVRRGTLKKEFILGAIDAIQKNIS